MPSGSGEKFAPTLTENVYGGAPPVAAIMHPEYAVPCVPAGHEAVVIDSGPPDEVTVTFVVAVVEPAALVAVSM
jgi:hypothetical protein